MFGKLLMSFGIHMVLRFLTVLQTISFHRKEIHQILVTQQIFKITSLKKQSSFLGKYFFDDAKT